MVNSWIVRLYKADDYSDEVAVIGDFETFKKRYLDDIVVFSGMYGLDDYFIWYIHKNIGSYDFTTVNVDLSLYLDGSATKTFWRKQYKILDIKYDARESKYVLFGISLDSAKLKTKLVDYQVKSLIYKDDPPRSPEQVLKDVLEVNDIFKVEYMEVVHEKDLRNFEYRMLTFDEDWTIEDFINYIADQNHFEWYVRNNVLYIGNECQPIKTRNATRKFDMETDNVSSTAWFKKYSGETRPMDVMSHISKVWRCVWVKHIAGASGGVTKGCFMRRGIGTLDKENYFKTLEGDPERNIASKLFINKPYSHYVTLGSIIKDEGHQDYIDQVSVQKNKELYKVNEPSDVKFDRVDEEKNPLKQLKHRVIRSTPYLDANAGLLFPSSRLEDEVKDSETNIKSKGSPPNSLIFQVKGKEESSVIGPFVYGNSEEAFKQSKIPAKNRDDFRLSFPNGWTLYVDKQGRTLIQTENRETDQSGPYANRIAKHTTYMYMKPASVGGASGASFSFNCTDGENTDPGTEKEPKSMGGLTVRFTENNGVSIKSKHKSNNKGINALFEKTKILHTVLEDVTDLDWLPEKAGIGNKTRYDQENSYIKLEHQNGADYIEIIQLAEDDILLRIGKDGEEKTIRILDSEIDIVIGDSSISLLEDEIFINSSGGDVNIDCQSAGSVKINSGGVPVSLEGHKHPFSGHVHPSTAFPGPSMTSTATPNIQGESDKHSKHLKVVKA